MGTGRDSVMKILYQTHEQDFLFKKHGQEMELLLMQAFCELPKGITRTHIGLMLRELEGNNDAPRKMSPPA